MSSGSQLETLWKLQTSANALILNEKRDPQFLIDFLQGYVFGPTRLPELPDYVPPKGWVMSETHPMTLATQVRGEDVVLFNDWDVSGGGVTGSERRRRNLNNAQYVPLGARQWAGFVKNPHTMPRAWFRHTCITFEGNVFVDHRGELVVPCIRFHRGDAWCSDWDTLSWQSTRSDAAVVKVA